MSSSTAFAPGRGLRTAGVYVLLLCAAVAAFAAIRLAGEQLVAPTAAVPTMAAPSAHGRVDVVVHVLMTLAAVIGLGHVLARFFGASGQPAVIGEVVAGIVLGPSLLGAISPEAMHWLIPSQEIDPHRLVLTSLQTIAQLGVVLYMFVVGLELNLQKVGRQAHASVAISHASIVLPFVLGSLLALWLYPALSDSSVPFTSFALFLGVAMAITAFPVLARILTDRGLDKTDLGVVALSCAATDDVTAWCLLAFVVGVAQNRIGDAIAVGVATLVFLLLMFAVVRPLLQSWIQWVELRDQPLSATPVLYVLLLAAALTTEAIGIHAVFGAFLLGAIIPHDSKLAQELSRQLLGVVTVLLLPAFFAVTGLNTRIGLIDGWESWLMCAAIIVVATLGKFGGTLAAARFTGLDLRTSAALGVLMNTRGLMELIVLNIGLSLGVISPKLFAMMVLMALATTLATSPLLRWVLPPTRELTAAAA